MAELHESGYLMSIIMSLVIEFKTWMDEQANAELGKDFSYLILFSCRQKTCDEDKQGVSAIFTLNIAVGGRRLLRW